MAEAAAIETPPAATETPPPAVLPGQVAIPGTNPAPAPKKPAQAKGARGPEVRIPQREFKARIDREAALIVKRKLGVTLEEAERIVKAAGSSPAQGGAPGAAATAVADEAVSKLRTQLERAQRELTEAKGKVTTLEKRNQKTLERMQDRLVDKDLRFLASQARINDPDYAITLYARAVKAAVAGGQEQPKPDAFFGGLKATHAYLFSEGAPAVVAPPVVVAPTTAPPESKAPGEVKPNQAPPGTPPAQANADGMSDQDFKAHARSKYGFSPGS